MTNQLTPEQEREALAAAMTLRIAADEIMPIAFSYRVAARQLARKYLDALAAIDELRVENQRLSDAMLVAEFAASDSYADARRWRSVRDRIFTSGNEKADEAADRLAAEQERTL